MGCDNHYKDRYDIGQYALPPIEQYLREGYKHPFLLLDSATIRNQARRFFAALPGITPHYAVKSNPDIRVLDILKQEGTSFEIASRYELDALLSLGVEAKDIFYSNPIKSKAYIEYAAKKGLEWYAIDCVEELQKVHQVKPDAKLYLRIYTSNEGSVCPLSGKFGANDGDIQRVIEESVALNADLAGVTFHVGSQCSNLNNWRDGIRKAHDIFQKITAAGLQPRLLNLGGGYPVSFRDPAPSIEDIAALIKTELAVFPKSVRIIAEPGRFMVAEAGCLVCSVVGTTQRNDERWLYLDVGYYNGLIELQQGISHVLDTARDGKLVPWTIAGPTCDSADVCAKNYPLPSDLREGDIIYIRNIGAYSNACAGTFNGFPAPEVIVL